MTTSKCKCMHKEYWHVIYGGKCEYPYCSCKKFEPLEDAREENHIQKKPDSVKADNGRNKVVPCADIPIRRDNSDSSTEQKKSLNLARTTTVDSSPSDTIKEIEKEDFHTYEKKWISKEGYICYIVFVSDHRCGYVRVSKENITNEIPNYSDIPVRIHGGLTYGSNGIWGFDCAHYGDTLKKWTLKNVEKEVENLSEQLSKISWKEIINNKLEYMDDWFKESFSKQKDEEFLEKIDRWFQKLDYNIVSLHDIEELKKSIEGEKRE
ncbi:MAG: hypothetical protein WC758_08145 [Candidatus Woesearchaeota archaeon]|jgi:hypothetical protein